MYAYVINHFGNNPKYLEYELYFLINLRANTKHDIIYMYSIYDTPNNFIDTIKLLNLKIKFMRYNDDGVTVNLKQKFASKYEHFNTLRTCSFIYAYLIDNYKKVCVLESDMYIIKNMDDIFELKSPSVFYTMNKGKLNIDNTNYKLNLDLNNMIDNCYKGSPINGGLLLIEPSKIIYNKCIKNIQKVIKNNCAYPNETLFLISNKVCYNLPIKYNFLHYNFKIFNNFNDIRLIHYNNTVYKPIDIIKDNYIEKLNINNKNIIVKYNNKIYKKNYQRINNILKKIEVF